MDEGAANHCAEMRRGLCAAAGMGGMAAAIDVHAVAAKRAGVAGAEMAVGLARAGGEDEIDYHPGNFP